MKGLKKAICTALSVSMAATVMAGLAVTVNAAEVKLDFNGNSVVAKSKTSSTYTNSDTGMQYKDTSFEGKRLRVWAERTLEIAFNVNGLENMEKAVIKVAKHNENPETPGKNVPYADFALYAVKTGYDFSTMTDNKHDPTNTEYGNITYTDAVELGESTNYSFANSKSPMDMQDVVITLDTTQLQSTDYDYLILKANNTSDGMWYGDKRDRWNMFIDSVVLTEKAQAPAEPVKPEGEVHFYTGTLFENDSIEVAGGVKNGNADQIKIGKDVPTTATVTFKNIDTTNLESFTVCSDSEKHEVAYSFAVDSDDITEAKTVSGSGRWNTKTIETFNVTKLNLEGGHDIVMTVASDEAYLDWIKFNYKSETPTPEYTVIDGSSVDYITEGDVEGDENRIGIVGKASNVSGNKVGFLVKNGETLGNPWWLDVQINGNMEVVYGLVINNLSDASITDKSNIAAQCITKTETSAE